MARRLSILYCITKLELGGAQLQLLQLIRALDKEKFQPFLFTAKSGPLMEEALCIGGLKVKKSLFLERQINPLKDFLALAELFYFIRRRRFDIVHTHSSKAGILGRLAARLAGAKAVAHSVHGWPFHNFQPRWQKRVYIFLERLAAVCCDKIIVVSGYDRKRGLSHGIGREGQYQLIPYSIDEGKFSGTNGELRKELAVAEGGQLVANISCCKRQKGLVDYLRACAAVKEEFPQAKFVLCGDGALRPGLEALAGRLGLGESFIFLGWRRDISRVLSAADVFVLTSLWEGLPVTLLEALAAGKPAVVTDTGGTAEVIQDGSNGFLVPCVDAPAAAEKIALLLRDRVLRERMSLAARQSIQGRFAGGRMRRETQELYFSLGKGA
jgi:glycosyltransferase involved in cell wall biosynthesis